MAIDKHVKKKVNNLSEGRKCEDEKQPKVNWLQHANALDNISSRRKFLSANFLYSLESQKPMSMRLSSCDVQNPQRLQSSQVEKAWHALSTLQISSRNYIRPGKTGPVKNVSEDLSGNVGQRPTFQSTCNISKYSEGVYTQKNLSGKNSEAAKHMGNVIPADNASHVQSGNNQGWPSDIKASSGFDTNQSNVLAGSFVNHTVQTCQTKEFVETSADYIDDDDLIESIDVDQIVMEHYQATCTPQPAISKFPLITPTADQNRFPSSVKASKQGKSEATPAKGSLMSGKLSPPQACSPAQPQSEVDLNLSAKLFSALRMLRTALLKEAGDGVMAYHIFGNATLQHMSKRIPRTKEELLEINGIGKAKVSKYGDRLLETIESTIREYNKGDRNCSGSNESTDSIKRRRDASKALNGNMEEEDEFTKSTGRSKKRTATRQKKGSEVHNFMEPVSCNQFLDDDLEADA